MNLLNRMQFMILRYISGSLPNFNAVINIEG